MPDPALHDDLLVEAELMALLENGLADEPPISLREGGIIRNGYNAALDELRAFLFDRVYIGSVAKAEEGKAVTMLRNLFNFYLENPQEMPEEFRGGDEDLRVRVCDYVAGMTDRFADQRYREHFVPSGWQGKR